MSGRLEGKVAIVTGAALGQGAAHVEVMAREGARVVAGDILDDEGRELVARLADEGLPVAYEHLDVADSGDWARVVRAAEERFGRITVLVNNAGATARTALVECTDEEWERAVAVNQTGIFYGMRAVIPSMLAAGVGSIVNVASVWAHTGGHHGYFGYVATKTAVLGMTRNVAINYGEQGVRANSISPGLVATRIMGTPAAVADTLAQQPIKRPAQPDEISHAVVFVASDESAYMTGADLLIDGGFLAQ